MKVWLLALVYLQSVEAYALAPPALARPHTRPRNLATMHQPSRYALPTTAAPRKSMRAPPPAMGLFGLGWPELAVIGVIALFFFGPEKLAPLAKDLGKSAGNLKEISDSFTEGVKEGTESAAQIREKSEEATKVEVIKESSEE